MLRNVFFASAAAAAGIGAVGACRAAPGFEKAVSAAGENARGEGYDENTDDDGEQRFSPFGVHAAAACRGGECVIPGFYQCFPAFPRAAAASHDARRRTLEPRAFLGYHRGFQRRRKEVLRDAVPENPAQGIHPLRIPFAAAFLDSGACAAVVAACLLRQPTNRRPT